mmetsp:Transcript_1795/g.3881  ORF Transcript_1795/g.3881 Transcript_1795/m.3881 type:complete len:116 (+) Transcript_1795:98-445(+)
MVPFGTTISKEGMRMVERSSSYRVRMRSIMGECTSRINRNLTRFLHVVRNGYASHPEARTVRTDILKLRWYYVVYPGSDADIVLLSEDLQVRATFVGGVLAWQHKEMNGAFWYYH